MLTGNNRCFYQFASNSRAADQLHENIDLGVTSHLKYVSADTDAGQITSRTVVAGPDMNHLQPSRCARCYKLRVVSQDIQCATSDCAYAANAYVD